MDECKNMSNQTLITAIAIEWYRYLTVEDESRAIMCGERYKAACAEALRRMESYTATKEDV